MAEEIVTTTGNKDVIVINPEATVGELLAAAEEHVFCLKGFLHTIACSTELGGDAETIGLPGAAFGMRKLAEQTLSILEQLQLRPAIREQRV